MRQNRERQNRFIVLALVALLAAGCGGEATLISLSRPAVDVVHLRDAEGVTVLDAEAGRVVTRVERGAAAGDWVFESRLTAAGTTVAAVDPEGARVWSTDLDGDLSVRVASHDGSRVALLGYDDAIVDPYNPVGRTRTRITVAPTGGGDVRAYDLVGNFEPEAFSTSGRSLFVIEYVPAEAPTSYRVRKLDLETGDIKGVLSVDGHLQESMRGTGRVSAMSTDGSRLYTLYTTDGPAGQTAFVHVLDLEDEWAHCVDLPPPFGTAPDRELAIVATATGASVYDEMVGAVHIDGAMLTVEGVEHVAMAWPEAIIVGTDSDGDRHRFWMLGPDAIYAVDPRTSAIIRTIPLPADFPPITVPQDDEQLIKCAC